MSALRSTFRNIPLGAVPAVLLLLIFFVIPFIVLAIYSFLTLKNGVIVSGPSFQGYVTIIQDPFMWYLFGRTIAISLFVTALCLLFGYPVAYLFTLTNNALVKGFLVAAVAAPLLTSTLVRTFAWLVILGREGLVNGLLTSLGIVEDPIRILFTPEAVILSMVQVLLPFMIVPLISTLQSLSRDVQEAATNLGATRWTTFWEVVFPQSVPGISAGVTLVFILAYTMFTVPTLMGGSAFRIVSVYIWNNVDALAWDTASQIASLLLITSLIIVTIMNAIFRRMAPWRYLHVS